MSSLKIESPNAKICAWISLEEFWSGNTVYPGAAVLRISYRGYPLVMDTPLSIDGEEIFYSLVVAEVDDSRSEMRLGPAVQKLIRCRERSGGRREFNLVLRISDVSVFMDISPVEGDRRGDTVFPVFTEGAPVLSIPDTQPVLAYVGPGALAASWRKQGGIHLVVFDRPGKLAEMRFGLPGLQMPGLIESGAELCRMLYSFLPFTTVDPGCICYGANIRPSLRAAFDSIASHFVSEDDDYRVLRGEPGEFTVVARRQGARWVVCGMTHAARTLTVRLEDLWLQMPAEARPLLWQARIKRDPVLDETGDFYEETFDDLAPDVRIAIDLKANGGFVVEFNPMGDAV